MTLKRAFDVAIGGFLLILTAPLIAFGAIGIVLISPGPVIYKSRRVGSAGLTYTMLKLRTMHAEETQGVVITGASDSRVFAFGAFLRKTKIDELPQLLNVVAGQMSLVGPRPEDPKIVETYYRDWMHETLRVAPGLTSPGALFGYTHGETFLDPNDVERSYGERLLPIKLALEMVYLRRAGFAYDLWVLWRTLVTVVQMSLGRSKFPLPPEMDSTNEYFCERDAACSSKGG